MNQISLAIHQTAHGFPGGISALAAAMWINKQVFINKCNPNSDTHHVSVADAMRMMLLSGNHAILRAMADELGFELREHAEQTDHDMLQALLKEQAEHGDVARTLHTIMGDNKITPREAAALGVQIDQAITALANLRTAAVLASSKRAVVG